VNSASRALVACTPPENARQELVIQDSPQFEQSGLSSGTHKLACTSDRLLAQNCLRASTPIMISPTTNPNQVFATCQSESNTIFNPQTGSEVESTDRVQEKDISAAQAFFVAHKDDPKKALEVYESRISFSDALDAEQIKFIVAGMNAKLDRYPIRQNYERWGLTSFDLAQAWVEKQKELGVHNLTWPKELPDGLALVANRIPYSWHALRTKIGVENFVSLVSAMRSEKLGSEGRKLLLSSAINLTESNSTDVPKRVPKIAFALGQQISNMTADELLEAKSWTVRIYQDEVKSQLSYDSLAALLHTLMKRNPQFAAELNPLRDETLDILKYEQK
jgi:hypothetical protein